MREGTYFHGVNKNNTTKDRAKDDYYGTPPEAVEYLLNYETFNKNILEPCVGGGQLPIFSYNMDIKLQVLTL